MNPHSHARALFACALLALPLTSCQGGASIGPSPAVPLTSTSSPAPERSAPATSAPTIVPATAAPTTAPASSAPSAPPTASTAATKVGHVWLIIEENESESSTFGAGMKSLAPYMSGTLKSQGAYLQNYYATGHASLDNYISMMSGQPGDESTNGDCGNGFNNFQGVVDPTDGIDIGDGCVYPTSILTLGDQLSAAGVSWRSYDEDMGNDAVRDNTVATPFACGHPNPGTPTGQTDPTQGEEATDGYATRHDPFMYFHSIIDVTTGANACANHVVNLQHYFANDLSSLATTPQFSFITPSLCDDGHNTNCAEPSADGTVGGLPGLDAYLRDTLIPTIESSAAYKKDGLIIVIFDESSGDDTACCNEYGQASGVAASEGGGITGGVLLSPMIAGPVVDMAPYNHYSLLRYLEGVFNITNPTVNGTPYLGYAMNATPFAAADFNNFGGPVESVRRRYRR